VCIVLLDSLGDEGLDVVDLEGACACCLEVVDSGLDGNDIVDVGGEEGKVGDGVDLPSWLLRCRGSRLLWPCDPWLLHPTCWATRSLRCVTTLL
jgi:hypothetical protein